MSDTALIKKADAPVKPASTHTYDVRRLTYSDTFTNPVLRTVIKGMEWLTGKWRIIRIVRRFERKGDISDHRFFPEALDTMGIPLLTPQDQIGRIPADGPVVVVANHPHGMVDGMVLADLIGRVRADYRILTRSVLVELHEAAAHYMISVPFPHDEDAQKKGLEMRALSMSHLKGGGVIGIFPSGVVASSNTAFGPAIEREWNVFTAKMIFRSNATVIPVKFPGQNSRWYHIANRVSATLRQGLLIHEIANQRNKPQSPSVGMPIPPADYEKWKNDPRGFIAHLRDVTMALPHNP
ncbi:MAG: lysophospholipid acyltransferase family protein [Pseudomonadota bacterium]